MAGVPPQRSLTPADYSRVKLQRASGVRCVEAAKARARSDLDITEWSKYGWAYDTRALKAPAARGAISYEHASSLTVDAFRARYEAPNVPVVLRGCCDDWRAWQGAWHPSALYKQYKQRMFRCGEDDKGYPVKLSFKHYIRYAAVQRDDSPMYIFDSMYNHVAAGATVGGGGEGDEAEEESAPAAGRDRVTRGTPSCPILHDYSVPAYFSDDLFKLVGEHRRPPYRWFLVGPARSGTGVHIDPLGTSAWNSLIYGRKRWVLFPPHVAREVVRAKAYKRPGEDDEPIDYFNTILPRIRAAGGDALVSQMIEFTQMPGETVFVPGGWWHAVLNLEDTVAVTQNFCSRVNFPRVWVEARAGRPGMARKWLRVLRSTHPELAALADEANTTAGWSLEAEAARHAARVARKREDKARKLAEGGDGSDAMSSPSSDSSDESSGSATSVSSDDDSVAVKVASHAPAIVAHARSTAAARAQLSDCDSDDDEVVITRCITAVRKRAKRADGSAS